MKTKNAHELATWFLGREIHTANPEDRKQVGLAKKLLKDYSPEHIRRAVRLRRSEGACHNLFEVLWSSKEGPMYISLASQIPTRPAGTDYVGWDSWIKEYGPEAFAQGLWDGSLPAGYLEYVKVTNERISRKSSSHRGTRTFHYEKRERSLHQPPVEDGDWS